MRAEIDISRKIKKGRKLRVTILELETELAKLKLPYRNYSLNGGYLEDGICLSPNKDIWEVYYCERGHKNVIGMFFNESDACEYMVCKYKKEADTNRWF